MIKNILIMGLLLSTNLFANFYDEGLTEYKKGNMKLASQLYNKACDTGEMHGCIKLGLMHYEGIGVKQNHKKSIKLFFRACKKRYSEGCFRLGLIYKQGAKGIKQDKRKAKMAFGKACNIGQDRSCELYDMLHAKGY